MSPAAAAARVALIERRGKFLVAEPFFSPGPRFAVTRDRRTSVGDLVVLRPSPGRNGRGGRAQVSRRLGRPNVARDVLEALMVDRGLARSFDHAVEREARNASEAGAADDGRRDLRSLATFTIDPASARDFDDAISAEAGEDGGWRVWVHIADVVAFVPAKSLVDQEAYDRATSVYVPGIVEPMLPASLSGGACSLVAGQDRRSVTVEMVIHDGRVTKSSFYRSLIRSDQRLSYGEVDRIFAGQDRGQEPWAQPLKAARGAAGSLGARRAAQASIVVDSAEPEFSFDDAGNVVAGEPVEQTESHGLIEQLMIAANEQVAEFLSARHVPALYRVHERPDGVAVERMIGQLASLGVPTPPVPKGMLSQQQAAEVAGEASQLVDRWVTRQERGRRTLTRLILRSLKQARYDDHNLGHSGLQSSSYCHFTSPIRRYPDVICHRALLSALSGEVPAPAAQFVAAAGPWTSDREREAMMIERDADDIARCFLLERQLAESGAETSFEGEVVGLIGAGAFVSFGEKRLYEGMLPVRRMPGDWWELNEEGTMLVGSRSGRTIRLGDPIDVRVRSIDAARGRVDLLLSGEAD